MSDVTKADAQSRPPINDAGDGQVIPETRAKQGRQGYQIFAVLAVSTVLAIAVMFGIWGLHAGKLSDAAASKTSRAAAAQSFNTPQSAPRMTPGPGSAPAAPDH